MVFEYCGKGNLLQVLRDNANKLSWDDAFRYLRDMTMGIKCLHTWNPAVFHR
jgi:serine/threonine protein kinase